MNLLMTCIILAGCTVRNATKYSISDCWKLSAQERLLSQLEEIEQQPACGMKGLSRRKRLVFCSDSKSIRKLGIFPQIMEIFSPFVLFIKYLILSHFAEVSATGLVAIEKVP